MKGTARDNKVLSRAAARIATLRDARTRRITYAFLAIILATLCVFPRQYVARAKILPQDPNSAGLSAIMGALGGGFQNFASLLGAHQSIDVYLTVGRSNDVLTEVVEHLHLIGRPGFRQMDQAHRKLARKVDVHSLMGGVIEVEAHDTDPAFARELVAGYSEAIRDRLSELGREHISEKKSVVTDRLAKASARLTAAQNALNTFRRENRLAEPEAQLGAAVALKTGLEARLQAKIVELQTAERFGTSENLQVKAVQSEITALRSQIAGTETAASGGARAPNLASMAEKSSIYLNLYRDVQFSQALFEVYTRYLEEVTVEDLVENTNANVQIVERPYVDPNFHVNIWAAALLAGLAVLAFYTEYYAPATGLGRHEQGGQ